MTENRGRVDSYPISYTEDTGSKIPDQRLSILSQVLFCYSQYIRAEVVLDIRPIPLPSKSSSFYFCTFFTLYRRLVLLVCLFDRVCRVFTPR